MIKNILLVGLGGAAGSILRYLTSLIVSRSVSCLFPWPTFLVNILGCLLIGLSIGLLSRHPAANADMRLLLMTGFCGGYTTFSAFAMENFELIQSGHTLSAAMYIVASVVLGVLAVWFGISMVP